MKKKSLRLQGEERREMGKEKRERERENVDGRGGFNGWSERLRSVSARLPYLFTET